VIDLGSGPVARPRLEVLPVPPMPASLAMPARPERHVARRASRAATVVLPVNAAGRAQAARPVVPVPARRARRVAPVGRPEVHGAAAASAGTARAPRELAEPGPARAREGPAPGDQGVRALALVPAPPIAAVPARDGVSARPIPTAPAALLPIVTPEGPRTVADGPGTVTPAEGGAPRLSTGGAPHLTAGGARGGRIVAAIPPVLPLAAPGAPRPTVTGGLRLVVGPPLAAVQRLSEVVTAIGCARRGWTRTCR
jgi:hypothetical protein